MMQLCHVFDVHRSSYRTWRDTPMRLSLDEKRLRARIRAAHTLSRGSAGARTVARMVTEMACSSAVTAPVGG